jgi:hypothetical protein
LREQALTSRYRLVHYHRVGCGQQPRQRAGHPLSTRSRCATAVATSRHSAGPCRRSFIERQRRPAVGARGPRRRDSLAILEPALMTVPAAATSRVFVGRAVEQYRLGDKSGAVDTFLRGTCGPGYAESLNRALPGALDRYAADAATFFEQELPALQKWFVRSGRGLASCSTGPGRGGGAKPEHGSDLGRAAPAPDELAPSRRALGASGSDPSAAGHESSRNGQRLGRVLVEAFPLHGVNDHRRACDGNGTSRRITLKTMGGNT